MQTILVLAFWVFYDLTELKKNSFVLIPCLVSGVILWLILGWIVVVIFLVDIKDCLLTYVIMCFPIVY